MTKPTTGRCLCGKVRFECAALPIARRACWCRDCQYLAAGNASINAIFRIADVTVTGETVSYLSTADSGNAMRRSFCPACGTPLFSASAARPDLIVIRAGALDDRSIARPEGFIWTTSAPEWGWIDQSLSNCPAQPAPIRNVTNAASASAVLDSAPSPNSNTPRTADR